MPHGPGDDILKALESGTSDDAIISKYKIDTNQLNAFKSLQYGLSNKKMAYEQINEYYPEIKSYFKVGPYIDPANKVTDQQSQANVLAKPDFTKPVREKAITESTAAPSTQKAFQAVADSGKPGKTLQQKFDENVKQGLITVNKEIAENDDVIEKMIREGRYLQAKEQSLTDFAGAPRTDMPTATALALDRNRILPPETKPQDVPVSPDEVSQKRMEFQGNEQQTRDFINKIVLNKPEKAKELQKSMYQLDAHERIKQTPDIGNKVNKMLNEIDNGNVTYNAVTRQLTRELGFVDALVSGVKARTKQMNDYDLFQQEDNTVMNLLEKRFASYDPDEPAEVPKGASEIGQMLGMEWKALLKGTATGIVSSAMGGEAAAPYISAAINAPEYYQRSYASGFEDTYYQARRQGKSPEESVKIAREQAKTEGALGAAEGAVSSVVGGRIGLRPLPKFNVTGSLKNSVSNVLKKSAHYAGDTTIDGLVDGLVAGYLQDRKDMAAAEKGIQRDTEQNIRDNIMGELSFSLAFGALTKAGKAMVDPNTYQKIVYWITKQNEEAVQSKLGEMVLNQEISQEDAENIQREIDNKRHITSKIPDDIKDVSRMAMADKIEKRRVLEQQLEQVDVALHPKIKEEIKKLNEEILEHSQHKKSTTDESETEAKTQAEAEGISIEPTEQEAQPQAPAEVQPDITTPADEGAAESNIQGTGTGDAAPAGDQSNELHYTNPEGTQYILRGDRLYYVNSSGEEMPFNDKAMRTKNAKELVATIKQANQQSTLNEQDVVIETEADVERELRRIMGNNAHEQLTGSAADTNSFTSPEIFLEKAQHVLSTLFPDLKVEVYDSEAEYLSKNNLKNRSYGFWSPSKNKISYNLEGIKEDRKNTTVFHEIIHPILNDVLSKKDETLGNLYNELESLGNLPGMEQVWDHFNKYFNKGGKVQRVEALTEFFALVATDQIKLDDKPDGTINRIIEFINKLFEVIGVSYRINNLVDLKSLSSAISQAFNDQDLTKLSDLLGNPIQANETADMEMLADQENAIRELIKKTPASIPDDRLREILVKATGITDQEAQDLIDEVRKPVVPRGGQLSHTTGLTAESRRVSLAKFDKMLEKQPSKEPNWWQRMMESVKNMSAYTDNPYRFITKITEDINKEYNRTSTEQIPLGRQFEKSASGRAILKVDEFINEVIRGRIGNTNLGRLTGKQYADFQRYLAAKRIIDRLNKQEEKQLAGEDVSRQTGNITRQDAEVMLEELENKYGNLDDFAARAKAFQAHMDTMLQTLVASGILSQETYDNIKQDNDFYAPFSIVQSKLYAQQDKQPVGISGIVKRIKGIDYNLIKTGSERLVVLNDLADALKEKLITPEEYFNSALQVLDDALNQGIIKQKQYDRYLATLENPGFAINDILDAAANMIYKAEGMALRNSMLQRLYAYKSYDKNGLYIQDVDGFDAKTLPDGTTRMVPKPLNSIKVEPGMAPIKLRVDGKDVIVAVNKRAADKITLMSNYEVATVLKLADAANRLFRAVVITVSPGFQVVNFAIDFVRTSMLSRYGLLAGKKPAHTLVNLALYVPQYMEALFHSAMGNVGFETKTYKQWMASDSFSKGMFANLFDNEKRIKEVTATTAKRMLINLAKFKFINVPGSILEQTHKLATHQRGMSVEGFKPEMYTSLLASVINRNINPNMSKTELKDASDRLNYEVQNFAGSPNFPETHRWMKLTSIFLQFFSARVKGEMTDYRRIINLFGGKAEGVKLSKQEVVQIGAQFLGIMGAIAAFAVRNNADDEDEKEFDGMPPFHKDNYLNIPLGYFEWEDEDGNTHILRDYAKVPLRGLTATMNVFANSFVKFYKRNNPDEFKRAVTAFAANASPINLHGSDTREMGESLMSNLTPIFKFYIEYSFNRDTHNHRNIVPDYVQGKGMLSKFRNGDIEPWEVATKKTPQWAKDFSKYLFETLGIRVSAIEIDHMENTMGNPTELYDNAIKKRLFRSEMKYPTYVPREEKKNTSSATVTPVVE